MNLPHLVHYSTLSTLVPCYGHFDTIYTWGLVGGVLSSKQKLLNLCLYFVEFAAVGNIYGIYTVLDWWDRHRS